MFISGSTGFREEVLNVKLAELLSNRGIISVPETILRLEGKNRLPDLMITDYNGLRVVLEGKINSGSSFRNQLEKECNQRLDEGICMMVIGVIYPESLRYSTWSIIEKELSECSLELKVFSEVGETPWISSDVEGLSEIENDDLKKKGEQTLIRVHETHINAWIKCFNDYFPNSGFYRIWDYEARNLSDKKIEELFDVAQLICKKMPRKNSLRMVIRTVINSTSSALSKLWNN